MIVLGGVFATLLSHEVISLYLEVFLVFPFVFTSLALAYADRTVRILRIATYIHQYLRENLTKELETTRLMQWEIFKKHRVTQHKQKLELEKSSCLQGEIKLWLKRRLPEIPLVLDVIRVAQFVMPSIFCILLFVVLYGKTWDILHILLTATSFIAAIAPVYFFAKSEETSGVSLVSEGADLVEWERKWRLKNEPDE